MEFLDLKTQQKRIRKPLEKRINKILDHGAYIMGPEVFELEEKLSIMWMSCPFLTSSSTKLLPINPAPPVTTYFIITQIYNFQLSFDIRILYINNNRLDF